MTKIRTLLVAVAMVWIPVAALATAQIPDGIVMDGERTLLHSEPLNALLWRSPAEGGIELKRPEQPCSGSWRGYRAEWRLQDRQLFLENVFTDACAKAPPEVPLSSLFPGRSGPIRADWFTGVLVIPQGKQTKYVHMGYQSVYERYVLLVLKKGQVVTRVDLDEPPQ
jgi:hypothetical protein